MIGARLGHFRITAKLGAGGMGEVYRAEDSAMVSSNPRSYGVTADGRILFLQIANSSDPGQPVLVRGFSRELERLRR